MVIAFNSFHFVDESQLGFALGLVLFFLFFMCLKQHKKNNLIVGWFKARDWREWVSKIVLLLISICVDLVLAFGPVWSLVPNLVP